MTNTLDDLTRMLHREFDFDPASIDADAPFAQYDLDSLTVAELIFLVEDAFRITIPDAQARVITTLRGLATVLDDLLASKAAQSAGA